MKKVLIILAILIATGFGFWKFSSRSVQPSPSPSTSLTPSGVPPLDYSKFSGPATCVLKGTIRFINQNTYNNGDALFTYKGIDHPGRNIFWKVSPDDGINIGPDIFTQFELPDGSSLLSLTMPEHPIAKRYTITASIQYGRLVDGFVKIFTAPCTGSTTVLLP